MALYHSDEPFANTSLAKPLVSYIIMLFSTVWKARDHHSTSTSDDHSLATQIRAWLVGRHGGQASESYSPMRVDGDTEKCISRSIDDATDHATSAERRCREWLTTLMKSQGPSNPKAMYYDQAKQEYGIGNRE